MGNNGSDGSSEAVFKRNECSEVNCEEVNGLGVSIVEEEFKVTGAGVSYLFDQATQLCADPV